MKTATFELCSDKILSPHGRIHFESRLISSPPFFSLEEAQEVLVQANMLRIITSSEADELLKEITEAGIPEDCPEEAKIVTPERTQDINRIREQSRDTW